MTMKEDLVTPQVGLFPRDGGLSSEFSLVPMFVVDKNKNRKKRGKKGLLRKKKRRNMRIFGTRDQNQNLRGTSDREMNRE